MARKTKKTIIEEQLPEPGDVQELSEAELPSNIDQVIDELEDTIDRIILYRRTPGQKQAYLRSVSVDEFGEGGVQDYVARYYGGGTYLARLQRGGNFIKGYSFTIDESVRAQPVTEKAPTASNTVTDQIVVKLLEKAVSGNGGGDMASMMQAIATIAAGQASAMMTAMTPLLAKITELASGGGKGGGSMADLVAAIQLGADMGGDKENSYLPVIREVGVPLVQALEKYMGNLKRPAPNPVPSIQKAVGAIPPGAPPALAPVPTGPPWLGLVAPYIPKLVDFAVHGGDPGVVAGLVYNANPPLARFLEDAVEAPEFAGLLVQHFPALAPHGAWVNTLLDEFREDPDDEQPAGDGETTLDGE